MSEIAQSANIILLRLRLSQVCTYKKNRLTVRTTVDMQKQLKKKKFKFLQKEIEEDEKEEQKITRQPWQPCHVRIQIVISQLEMYTYAWAWIPTQAERKNLRILFCFVNKKASLCCCSNVRLWYFLGALWIFIPRKLTYLRVSIAGYCMMLWSLAEAICNPFK